MTPVMVSIGFKNMVSSGRIIAIVGSDSSPSKKIISEARDRNLLIDASKGRKTRSILVMDDEHVILSALLPETIGNRINSKDKNLLEVSPEEIEEEKKES